MLIILEGNECCFKTTVAEKLSKKLGWDIVKGSSFELAQCNNAELFEHFLGITHMKNKIVDRYIYSNLVYASLYKDFAIINEEQQNIIEDTLKDKAIIVYLYASPDVIKERLEERGDDYVEVDMIESINEKYDQVTISDKVYNTMYDTEYLTSDEIVNQILAEIDEQNNQ